MKNTDNSLYEPRISVPGSRSVDCWQRGDFALQQDWVAEEVPVALVYNGISHVVMMASPKDLEVFALGFSLSEGIAVEPQDILGIDVERHPQGIEVNIELSSRRFTQLKIRRRNLAGRTGCGICGVEQLDEIAPVLEPLTFTQNFSLSAIDPALQQMREYQPIGAITGCTHVALWLDSQGQILGGCEDIGRHVALDKLLGMRSQHAWQQGALLVSSRASYEMVQKAVMCGVEIMFAVSAVTSLAVDIARKSNLTLVGFSRQGKATLYSHPERLRP